ncbi:MAG: hypothetical protein MJ233_03995 [Mycoplasmoidaceae bacterium]|nr:hypothetical protein [Mycoplasmoidaceae bacterium]
MREEKIIPQDDNENVLTNDYYKCISERPLIFAEDLVYAFADYQQPEDSKSNDAPV